MRLRDRFRAAVQTFREAPDLQTRLTTSEYERSLVEQMLEMRERECEGLRNELGEKDARLRFLYARADALSSALTLKEFSPRLSATDEMKRFYNAVSRSMDPEGFTLHHVAERLAGVDTVSLFPYEDACGAFETANGHELLKYLTAYRFGAVEWEVMPGTTYEKAVLGAVDTSTPEYRQFEHQLYKSVLERMGFDTLLAPGAADQQVMSGQQAIPDNSPVMAM